MTDEEDTLRIKVPYAPRRWQAEMHKKLKRFTVLPVHRGAGKGLALDTPLVTPSGFTPMGEIEIGDRLIDRDGQLCHVIAVSEIHHLPCYEVEFNSGEKIICDETHLWLTQSGNERDVENSRKRRPELRARLAPTESAKPTKQIAATLEDPHVHIRHGIQQKDHRVRVVPPVQFPDRVLPIDPYVLGYWLGDGDSRGARITVGDEDREAFILKMAERCMPARPTVEPMGFRIGVNGRNRGNRDTCVKSILRVMGVLQNKHIPSSYLRGSEEQRWLLLQGIMDSDGYADKRTGRCDITLTNRRLLEDTRELVASLGFRPHNMTISRAKINGRDVGERYRFGFQAFADQPVFGLARKQARLPERSNTGHNYQRNRMIVAVRPVPSVPTRCIQVDSPTHTFCVGRSFIPTHNSIFAINELVKRAMTGPINAEYAYILPLRNQAQRNVVDHLKRFVAPIPNVDINNASLTVRFPNGAKLYILGADNPDTLRGMHLHYLVLDEVADMHPDIWIVCRPMLTNHRGGVLFIGTPKGHNTFYDLYMLSQDPANRNDWYGEILPYQKTGALDVAEVELARQTLTTNGFEQEMECSFEAAIRGAYYGGLISQLREDGRISSDIIYRPDLDVITSWDLGVRDRTAIWFYQLVKAKLGADIEINIIDYVAESGMGLPQWADVLKEKAHHYGYNYGTHIAPFDIKNREFGSGISRLESAEQVGIHFVQCPEQSPMDGIELVRKYLPICRFYAPLCYDGLEDLSMYRAKIDRQGQGLGPEHSKFSHAADSLRYGITYIMQVMQTPAIMTLPFLRRR